MSLYQFILAMVHSLYVGFALLNQLQYIARDPLFPEYWKLPTCAAMHALAISQFAAYWNCPAYFVYSAPHAGSRMGGKYFCVEIGHHRHRYHGSHSVWQTNGIQAELQGRKSYQPILSFLAETREFVAGELRNGDRPTGKQIARHLQEVFQSLPCCVTSIGARGRFRILLLGSRGSLRQVQVLVYCNCAKSISPP
jgi:hypothetical protein